MPGKKSRKGIVSRDNPEDGGSQTRSRTQSSSSHSHSRIMLHNRTPRMQEFNNMSNNVMSSDTSCKQPKNTHRVEDTSSSENEEEKILYSLRHRILRSFSEHETGESSNRNNRPTRSNMTKQNEHESDLTCPRLVSDSDSLSDDSIVRPRIAKSLKRPLSPTSTSDSSDSGVPLASRRYVKRMKLISSSGSSISESSSDSDYNTRLDIRDELVDNTSSMIRVNPVETHHAINSRQAHSVRRRRQVINGNNMNPEFVGQHFWRVRIQTEEMEDEGVSVSNGRRVMGRRIPVVESEDDSDSLSNTNNIEILHTDERNQVVSRFRPTRNLSGPVTSRPTHNVRRRRRVNYSNNMNTDFNGRNVLRVRTQAEETEDDGVSVLSGRRVMGRRIPVVESEDDADSTLNTNNQEILIPDERNQVVSRFRPTRNLRGPVTSRPTHNARRRRRVNYSNNMNPDFNGRNFWRVRTQAEETEDNGVSVSSGRRVMGRRIPVVESEDDTESTFNTNNQEILTPNEGNEDVDSLESNFTNLRRRRVTPLTQTEEESNTSDSDIRPRALSNRMVPIFQSDDSSSTSSSSSTESDDSIPIRNARRRNRPIPIVDYDYEDIANDFIGFDVNIKASTVKKARTDNKVHNGNSSDTDGESEKCPICLAAFKLQEIGKPTSCDHKFCSMCIKEWATKNNTCPVDRKTFNGIVVYDKIEGVIVCELPVEKAIPPEYDQFDFIEEFLTDSSDTSWYFDDSDGDGPEEICSGCGSSFRPHRMISCDACNTVYHLECVDPPLRDFPTINWYCSHCDYNAPMFAESS